MKKYCKKDEIQIERVQFSANMNQWLVKGDSSEIAENIPVARIANKDVGGQHKDGKEETESKVAKHKEVSEFVHSFEIETGNMPTGQHAEHCDIAQRPPKADVVEEARIDKWHC